MKHCLWCNSLITLEINWSTLFFPPVRPVICENCSLKLIRLPEVKCDVCSRASDTAVCHDCMHWKTFYNGKDPLTKNCSVYAYNEFIQEMISKWKYRGDFILAEIFRSAILECYQQQLIPKINNPVILPIPLSEERLHERAYNQAVQLASFLNHPILEHKLIRINSEKQSKKSRIQRMSTANPFVLQEPVKQTAILVDDIYTTGRTLRHAAELLKHSGCPDVYALTLVRS